MIDHQGRHLGAPLTFENIGLIHCDNDKCGFPLAFSLGRSLVLGSVVLRAMVRLECTHCGRGLTWAPSPREDKKAGLNRRLDQSMIDNPAP